MHREELQENKKGVKKNMKNFLLNKLGKGKKKQKFKKMSGSTINAELLNRYSKEYIRKTTDFQILERVEIILAELAQQYKTQMKK